MKVLLSAFACAPETGSEPEIGFVTARAAAQRHDVWVLLQDRYVEPMTVALTELGLADRVTLLGVPSGLTEPLPGLVVQHWKHDAWQRAAATRALEVHRSVGFDVVHHVTLTAYWTRIGAAAVDAPLVLGPLGGGVEVPPGLLPVLGSRGLAEYVVRSLTRRVSSRRPAVREPLRRAAAVLLENPETGQRFPGWADAPIVPPQVATEVSADGAAPRDEIAMVGRLAAWKGGTLAVRALAGVADRGVRLAVYGNGPDRSRMVALAERLGVADRLTFSEWIPRGELLARVASSRALLHPSLHEEGGFAVAEALALGTPVVALDHGGPAALVRSFPGARAHLVRPRTVASTAAGLASALDAALASAPSPAVAPVVDYDTAVLDAYDRAVAARAPS